VQSRPCLFLYEEGEKAGEGGLRVFNRNALHTGAVLKVIPGSEDVDARFYQGKILRLPDRAYIALPGA
jgi:hypothetical protein